MMALRVDRIVVLSLVVLLATTVTAASDLESIQSRGKITMLCVPHQENVFVHTKVEVGAMPKVGTTDQFAGVDVELMAGFAGSLGVDLEIRPVLGEEGLPSYAHLIPALLRGEGDVIASSFSITPARAEKVTYTDPYYTVRPVVVSKTESGIKSVNDLTGKVAGTIRGSSHHEHLMRLGFEDENIKFAGFMLENYLYLSEGEVDFIIVDSTSAFRLVPRFEQLAVACELEGEDNFGYAVRPNSDIKDLLNTYLKQAKEDGCIRRLLELAEPGIEPSLPED
jgi:ABC-type amino acid transport substrate-binding protein